MGVTGYDAADPFRVTCCPERLDEPLRMKTPGLIGVSLMGDLLHPDVPIEFIRQVFDTMRQADWHTFVLLTKRPNRLCSCLSILDLGGKRTDNLWCGTSIESREFLHRIDVVHQFICGVRFVSFEPLLYPIGMVERRTMNGTVNLNTIDWVIAGCESGPNARPMECNWVREIRDQCVAVGVPFFFKQAYCGRIVSMPELDGRVWAEMPKQTCHLAQTRSDE
jgi:protein gp37